MAAHPLRWRMLTLAVCGIGMAFSSDQNTEERIRRIEAGVMTKPIQIGSEEPPRATLASFLESISGLSVAVVDEGRVAWAKGYGVTDQRTKTPVMTDTLFHAGSISKAVTAVTVLRLVDAGKLDLDRDVNEWLVHWKVPPSAFTRTRPVTVRHLLSHSSGIEQHWPTAYAAGSPMPTLLQMLNGEAPAKSSKVEVAREPGTEFSYSSAAFGVLEQLLIDRVGKPFPEIVKREVFTPAGMEHSTFVQPADGEPLPSRATAYGGSQAKVLAFPELATAGLWSTPTDLARLLIALQKSGERGGLLSKKSYQELLTPVVRNAALGFFLAGSGTDLRFRVRGTDGAPTDGFTAWMTGYTSQGKGAVVMANSNGLSVGFSLLRAIAREYQWPNYIPTRTTVALDPKTLSAYLGKYDTENGVVDIVTDGRALFVQMRTRRMPLFALGADSFFLNMDMFDEIEVRFRRTSSGDVDAMIVQQPAHVAVANRVDEAR